MEQTQEKIIENGYRLVSILDELAEERENFKENFNADDELDRRFIFANKKLADALRHYIKVNYGDAVLYQDDEYEPTTISDDTITGD